MTQAQLADALAVIVFVAFTFMLIAASLSVAVRVGHWQMRRVVPPMLLYRDLITFSGLSFSFLTVAMARVLELPPEYTRTVPWIVFTSAPALIGMAVFLYFEWFVIGRKD